MRRNILLFILTLSMLFSGIFVSCSEKTPEALELTVYCFSAGKADAFLLYTKNSAVLIDTGESGFGKTICDYCSAHGIESIDYLIITHFDKDHVGGAKKVLETMTVKNVLQSNCPQDNSSYDKYLSTLKRKKIEPQTPREDLTFVLDGVSYTINPPAKESYDTDPSNNASLITTVVHGDLKMLFTGDARNDRLTEFLKTDPGSYDFLKMPHHGEYQKILKSLMAEVQPAYALICSSEDEREEERTVELLAKYSAECFYTRVAPVILKSDGSSLSVIYDETER